MTTLTTKKTWALARVPRPSDLTEEERANVRCAHAFLRVRLGGGPALAARLGMTRGALAHVMTRTRKPSVVLALRVSRAANVAIDAVLCGEWPADGACPHCGRAG